MDSANAEDGGVVNYDTISYIYDARGNLLSKTYLLDNTVVDTVAYNYTDTVWNDRLTAFAGEAITYDQIGNPLNWTDNATLTWQRGRQLASFTRGSSAVSYTYNDDGIRTSKIVNDTITNYTVVDGTLYTMSDGTNTLQFFENSVLYNGTEYWYVYNAQNDVIGLIDANGEYVVEYTYSAYGLPLSKTGSMADTLGTLNPFRYRGYIYDEETGLYYCNSRYYDPSVGRWLNADKYVATGSGVIEHNMYAYCNNHPIRCIDPYGTAVFYITLFSVSAYLVSGVNFSCGIAFDTSGNLGVFETHGLTMSTGASAGAGLSLGVDWETNTLEEAAESSISIGGSINFPAGPVPCYGGIDAGLSLEGGGFSGVSLPSGVGVGAGVDFHFNENLSNAKWFNIPSAIDSLVNCYSSMGSDNTTNVKQGSANAYIDPPVQYFRRHC